MFGTGRTGRARAAQRVAEDAWGHLLAAVESAGDTARSATRRTADAGSSVTAAADEARRRASAAMDALTGRRPRARWEWVAGAVVAGLVVGWFAAAGARRATAERGPRPTPTVTDKLDASASPEY